MKITKKVAKEVFNGDFSNVNFDEIKTNGRERVLNYYTAKELYKRPEYILAKDFDSLEKMELVHTAGEEYARAKRGVHLQTDVLVLKNTKETGIYEFIAKTVRSTKRKLTINLQAKNVQKS